MGNVHIIWNMFGEVSNNIPLYTDLLSAIPSLATGAYAGRLVSRWLSERMIDN